KRAADTLRGFGRRLAILHIRYDEPGAFDKAVAVAMEVVEASSKTTIFPVAAVLLDLGVNSYQLDEGSRGFSYTKPGPLDMRMDTSKGVTASQFLQEVSFADLKELFYENGEYKYATKLAKEIISHNPITTTQELSQIVEGVIPKSMRRRGHPAKRVFQALRIAVNEEITFLADALGAAFEVLTVGGRLLVLSYHSGEDRTVKNKFSLFATGGCSCPKNLPCRCGALIKGKLLTKGSLVPTKEEIADNPRAASARLRVIEKIQPIYLKDFQ
ncbi:MAG: 16S rRNA (cytosine(1402)-N(4))-methyltransferase RsmH, partial [Firmicutes bacterium]|nr:16S rRNA (cytosine(1402)-N(4))-methyltransferase RsmH [Bacillota bacterium]